MVVLPAINWKKERKKKRKRDLVNKNWDLRTKPKQKKERKKE